MGIFNMVIQRRLDCCIARSDSARGAYYKSISDRSWGTPHGYELCVDSSIGTEETANLIYDYIRQI